MPYVLPDLRGFLLKVYNVALSNTTEQFHTSGLDDLGGCVLAISYKSNSSQVTPEDFTVFSVNQTCVWERETHFQVPKDMPPCPDGKCTCAWFWIHQADAGSEQSECLHTYMVMPGTDFRL